MPADKADADMVEEHAGVNNLDNSALSLQQTRRQKAQSKQAFPEQR